MVLTLCHDCLQPFIDDRNYVVKLAKRIPYEQLEPHDNECDICTRRGRQYDVNKIKETKNP